MAHEDREENPQCFFQMLLVGDRSQVLFHWLLGECLDDVEPVLLGDMGGRLDCLEVQDGFRLGELFRIGVCIGKAVLFEYSGELLVEDLLGDVKFRVGRPDGFQ